MPCRHCGHLNPPENRFCGMCGHLLLTGSKASERLAEQPAEKPASGAPSKGHGGTRPEAERGSRAGTLAAEERFSAAAEAAPPPPKRDSGAAPLTGPSFLGLSNEPSTPAYEPSGYSYLFQDEPESSHRGLYVFLLLLVIAGGVAYWRWQPIREYAVTNLIPRLRQLSNPPQPPPPPTPPARDQASISVASSQAEEKAPEAAPPQPDAAEPQKQAPQAESAQPDGLKKADAVVSKKESPDAEADTTAEDTAETPPAARHSRPQPPPGEALVNTGEKYLYGRGVRKNCTQAVSYFRAAAEQQNPRALSRLGTMYAIGECVPLDRAIAYSWFGRALALDRGNRILERNMSMLWREMSPAERQRAGGR